jgi:hypothetical protein
VKRPNRIGSPQLNLPLATNLAVEVPEGKQAELTLALVELLIGGFKENLPHPRPGGENESEVDR